MSCLFCCIIAGTLPTHVIYQDEYTYVIQDIKPAAPIHYLIIPKKHYSDINAIEYDSTCMQHLIKTAQHLSTANTAMRNFRLVINSGAGAGQIIFHLHIHFLAGFEQLDNKHEVC